MMLRDCLVCGVNHRGIQTRLLAKKELTFEKALEVALSVEAAEKDVRQIQVPSAAVMYHRQGTGQQAQKGEHQMGTRKATPAITLCHRCLGSHLPQMCQFKQAECHKCHKKGHIARACKSRQNRQGTEPGKSNKKTHYVNDSLQPSEQPLTNDSTYNLFTIGGSGQNPIVVELTVNNLPVQMELDTGASLSLLNKQTYDKIPNLQLQPTDIQLKTYTEVLQILGEAKVTVNYGEQTEQLVVYVVKGNGPNLMGRDWLSSLQVSIGNIHKLEMPNKLSEILDRHKSVFTEGLGTFKGGKLHFMWSHK